MAGAPLTGSEGGYSPSVVPSPHTPEAVQNFDAGLQAGAPGGGVGIVHQFLGGVNPIPFVVALVALGIVMMAAPKAAVPLAVVVVLGALLVDRQALTAFQSWQKGMVQ